MPSEKNGISAFPFPFYIFHWNCSSFYLNVLPCFLLDVPSVHYELFLSGQEGSIVFLYEIPGEIFRSVKEKGTKKTPTSWKTFLIKRKLHRCFYFKNPFAGQSLQSIAANGMPERKTSAFDDPNDPMKPSRSELTALHVQCARVCLFVRTLTCKSRACTLAPDRCTRKPLLSPTRTICRT